MSDSDKDTSVQPTDQMSQAMIDRTESCPYCSDRYIGIKQHIRKCPKRPVEDKIRDVATEINIQPDRDEILWLIGSLSVRCYKAGDTDLQRAYEIVIDELIKSAV